MDASQSDRQEDRVPIPFARCNAIETEFLINSLAERPLNVVFLGETGTGKSSQVQELYTRWLLRLSPDEKRQRVENRQNMFEAFLNPRNFDSKYRKTIEDLRKDIPSLKELPVTPVSTNLVGAGVDTAPAELFGVLPGVFTTVDFRLPRIALANQSMLFIDELRYVPPMVQAQLLTTIQERSFAPLGGMDKHQIKNLDVWYVAALTPPYQAILPELFYRLGLFVIELAALDKIKYNEGLMNKLVGLYLKEEAKERNNASPRTLSKAAINRLQELTWPGNLRQLANVIRRAASIAELPSGEINEKDIDRAVKFDAASHLTETDIVTRLSALFREGAYEKTPLTSAEVDRTLAEAFTSEVGRARAMDFLEIGAQAYNTMLGKPRGPRVKRSTRSEDVQPPK